MDNQLQIYKNHACLRPWRIVRAKLCCREAIEEQMLAGHLWELRSSVLRVVYFAGF
jgi:hypothetical protein